MQIGFLDGGTRVNPNLVPTSSRFPSQQQQLADMFDRRLMRGEGDFRPVAHAGSITGPDGICGPPIMRSQAERDQRANENAKVVGSLGAGAVSGASIGMAIGSIVPGAGTILGGATGAAIGVTVGLVASFFITENERKRRG